MRQSAENDLEDTKSKVPHVPTIDKDSLNEVLRLLHDILKCGFGAVCFEEAQDYYDENFIEGKALDDLFGVRSVPFNLGSSLHHVLILDKATPLACIVFFRQTNNIFEHYSNCSVIGRIY